MEKTAERFVPNAGRDAMHCVCTPAQAYKCAGRVSRMSKTGDCPVYGYLLTKNLTGGGRQSKQFRTEYVHNVQNTGRSAGARIPDPEQGYRTLS